MFYYDRIGGVDPAESNNSTKCIVCHYLFFNHQFKFQNSVFNGCHDLMMFCLKVSDITVINVKYVGYRVIHDIRKSEANHVLENPVLDNHSYI